MSHTVRTKHIRALIHNADLLAEAVHGERSGTSIALPEDVFYSVHSRARVEDLLEKAVADLRHAADELDAERLSCKGWKQV